VEKARHTAKKRRKVERFISAMMLLMMPAAPSMLECRSLDLSRCKLLTVPPAGGWQEVAMV